MPSAINETGTIKRSNFMILRELIYSAAREEQKLESKLFK